MLSVLVCSKGNSISRPHQATRPIRVIRPVMFGSGGYDKNMYPLEHISPMADHNVKVTAVLIYTLAFDEVVHPLILSV